ncbi:hypothetical protein JOC34_003437 [Virgibacillus halotolerans]|uniref:hypothetical protein n=1 Tax=Virgibacillus halotolerans TaxID=1071053 RepID=UPI00195F91CE|nr:hypothetical protein [Virgibacillus halotolerans]MBM7601016.1 hypothetical protein [Virgibacillus halotolerans]
MKRDIRLSEKFLVLGYIFILLFMIVQDLVPLGALNDIEAIASVESFNEIIVTMLIGAVQILLILGGVLLFIGKRYPLLVRIWLLVHPTCILLGAIMSWWIPYLLGTGTEEKVERFNIMFGNTHSFLPIMNGIVPNTLHTMFHLVLLICIILTSYVFLTSRDKDNRIVENKARVIH